MTRIFACHQGKERSVVIAGLFRVRGDDAASFDGGIERMVTLTEDELAREVTENDEIVLICEPWGKRDPQLRAVEQAEDLLSRIKRTHSRSTTRDLMLEAVSRR